METIQGRIDTEAGSILVLANVRNNEKFCLGFACVDGGDDGYSPLAVFGLELGSGGQDGDDWLGGDDDWNEDDTGLSGATWCAPGAERCCAGQGRTGWRDRGRSWALAVGVTLGLARRDPRHSGGIL